MGSNLNVKFFFVDTSLKLLRYVISACAILYTLYVGMDAIIHGKLKNPNWSKQHQE
jgi:hypothetical protein